MRLLTLFTIFCLLSSQNNAQEAFDCETRSDTTPINVIQGTGKSSPLVGTTVLVDAIVTANFQHKNKINGFFIESHINERDSNPETSEGVFVFSKHEVQVGQRIQFKARVKEYYGLTELVDLSEVKNCTHSNQLIQPTPNKIQLSSDTNLEAVEGMRVTIDPAWISDNHQALRFGELTLSGDTNWFSPQAKTKEVIINDGLKGADTSLFSQANSLRLGAQIGPVTGLIYFSFGHYHLLPITPITIKKTNHPEIKLAKSKDQLRIAQMNLRNLFNGPKFPTSRGKKTDPQYQLQLTKIAKTFAELDADIIALTEIENDGYLDGSAIQDLTLALNQLNKTTNQYEYIHIIQNIELATDEITQGFLYRPDRFKPEQANYLSLKSDHQNARPALIIEGTVYPEIKPLSLSLVHLRSRRKACYDDSKNLTSDNIPKEGYCHNQRFKQLSKLIEQLNPNNGIQIILGDFNAYPEESTLLQLSKNGWQNSREIASSGLPYTYVYQNNPTAIDHFYINQSSSAAVKQHFDWHINAAESDWVFEQELKQPLDQASYYRSSDHDPSLLILDLSN